MICILIQAAVSVSFMRPDNRQLSKNCCLDVAAAPGEGRTGGRGIDLLQYFPQRSRCVSASANGYLACRSNRPEGHGPPHLCVHTLHYLPPHRSTVAELFILGHRVWTATNTPSWLGQTVLSSLWFLNRCREDQTSFPMCEEGLQQSCFNSSAFS